MEAFLFSLGPVFIKGFTGLPTDIYSSMMFLGAMTIYTYVYLLYRCKYKTENKPNVNLKKTIASLTPFFIWTISMFVLATILSFSFQPYIFLAYNLISTTIALWIISFFFYYPSVRLSHGDCFPSVFSSIWGFIKALIPGI